MKSSSLVMISSFRVASKTPKFATEWEKHFILLLPAVFTCNRSKLLQYLKTTRIYYGVFTTANAGRQSVSTKLSHNRAIDELTSQAAR